MEPGRGLICRYLPNSYTPHFFDCVFFGGEAPWMSSQNFDLSVFDFALFFFDLIFF